jgi:hypothetical protein
MLYVIFLFSYEGIPYNLGIDSMIATVDSAELIKWNREISGEDKVLYMGDSVLILTRYYDSYEAKIAEDYLYEYFKSLDLETYKQLFWLQGGLEKKLNYDSYRWTGKYPGFYVKNDTLIYMVSTDGILYYSSNAGYRWVILYEFSNEVAGVLNPVLDTLYVFSKDGEFYFSEDGGSNFERRDSLLPSDIQDMYFLSGKKGWIISATGVVAITDDAGLTWDTVSTGATMARDIYFNDSLNGWFCGFWGRIRHTKDGGYTWMEQDSPLYKNLQSIYFMNADTGYICGDDGTVLRTTDGGDEWYSIGFSTSEDFRVIYFRTFHEGWVGGNRGNLYYTSDGGNTWENILASKSALNSIFDTGDYVFICGERDIIFKDDTSYINRNSYLPNAVCNIIAIKPGIVNPETTVVIGAHFDSWSGSYNYIRGPGANDNGTGVNTVREAARILSDYDFDYTIEYILYGAEEIGLVGSEYYADNARVENKPIKGVINLDCLGYDNIGTHNIDVISDTGGSDFALMALDVIWLYSIPLSVVHFDTTADFVGTDITSFWEVGYSGVNFWNNEFGPINSIYDSIHVINPSMHFNMTKLVVGELAYMANYSYLSVPEDLFTPIAIEIESELVKGSSFSFKITTSKSSIGRINLYDVTGRLVGKVFEGRIRNGEIFDINKLLNTGVYFIKIECDIGSLSKKLIILN